MINPRVLFKARVSKALSPTDLARKTGLTLPQLNDLEHGRDVVETTITLDMLRRLCAELGVELHALFVPTGEPSAEATTADVDAAGPADKTEDQGSGTQDDVPVLASLLLAAPRFRRSDIATALRGWDESRVRCTVGALNAAIVPTGLTFREADDGTYQLTPTAGQTTRPEQLRAVQTTLHGGTPASMRSAYDLLAGPVPWGAKNEAAATRAESEALTWLEEAGILHHDHDIGAIGLTDAAAHGLMLPDAGWPPGYVSARTP